MKVEIAKKIQNKEGFTLVELMIVVAIIGILAAIAIPQFAAYRIRGFNASAQSDVRNTGTAEAALFADWQRYGATISTVGAVFAAADPGGTVGAVCLGGDANGDGIATVDTSGVARGVAISVGNNVTVIGSLSAAPAAGVAPLAATIQAKHIAGDTTFGMDTDASLMYQSPTLVAVAVQLAVGNMVAATIADDFAAVAAGVWVAK